MTDRRMQGSNVRNLLMFRKLCGDDAYDHVVLATTVWDDMLIHGEGVERERQLINIREWWGHMHERGCRVLRHDGETDSALAIVAELLECSGPVLL